MVYFKEVLPNPPGQDSAGEWIKLVNLGDAPADLTGWAITDASGRTFFFNGQKERVVLLPGQEVILPYSATRLSLNNTGETLVLTNASGEQVDILNYKGPIAEDEIVFGEQFAPAIERQTGAGIGELALAGEGSLVDTSAASFLFVGVLLASVAGVLAALFAKHRLSGPYFRQGNGKEL